MSLETDAFEPLRVAPSPSDVLAMLQNSHRQQCAYDPEVDSTTTLTLKSTIAEWREARGLLEWRQLGRALDQEWQVGASDATWRSVLAPDKKRTLGELGEFLAARSKVDRVRPVKILGRECLSAGAFLTIQTLLGRAGADVSNLARSTELASYTRHYSSVFFGPISKLSPNAIPTVKIQKPEYALFLHFVSWILVLTGLCCGSILDLAPFVTCLGVLPAGVSYLAIWIEARCVPPAMVTFGPLRTFRDLSLVIACSLAEKRTGEWS